MNYYIIIRGPLGIGKSTIARRLSEILNAEYIPIDKVQEENNLDKEDSDYTPEDFIKTNEIVLSKVKKNLAKGKIVIFDGCFYFKEQIDHIIQNLLYPHYIFTLKAPLEVCIERDSKRKKTYGKDAATAVHYLVSKFDYGTTIDISKKSIDQAVQEILSYLPK